MIALANQPFALTNNQNQLMRELALFNHKAIIWLQRFIG
jgi:hypothetical protein